MPTDVDDGRETTGLEVQCAAMRTARLDHQVPDEASGRPVRRGRLTENLASHRSPQSCVHLDPDWGPDLIAPHRRRVDECGQVDGTLLCGRVRRPPLDRVTPGAD